MTVYYHVVFLETKKLHFLPKYILQKLSFPRGEK